MQTTETTETKETKETKEQQTEEQVVQEKQTCNPKIVAKLKELLAQGMFTQRTLAQRINYSEGTLSQYLKGQYSGNVEKFEKELAKYFKLFENRIAHKRLTLDFENTSVAQKIKSIANMCQFNGDIGCCYGASGLGKTTAIKQIAQENSGIIIVDPDEKASQRTILKQIAEQLKISELDIYFENAVSDVVTRLKNNGYLIIVDEAENLDSNIFRMIRKIHDRCEFTLGVLFVGTERLFANLLKFKGEYDYVLNRISRTQILDVLTSKDIELLVHQVFPDCSALNLKVFEQLCNKNARILFNMLKNVKDMSASYKEPLNQQMIEEARSLLPA